MAYYAGPVATLIDEFAKLPGIGSKTAQRLTFHILKSSPVDAKKLARAIDEVKDKISFCEECFNVTDQVRCEFCRDANRDQEAICVIEEPRDIVALEKTGEFRGLYHVLQGAISPIDGISPDDIRVRELLKRLGEKEIKEVVIATNPNIEGEATAMYLARLIKPLGITVTRIASGLPVGGDLEYADEVTLARALEGRREM